MNLSAGRDKLQYSLDELREHWKTTADHWNDGVRREFEEKFLALVEEMSRNTLQATDRLSQVLRDARRDCE